MTIANTVVSPSRIIGLEFEYENVSSQHSQIHILDEDPDLIRKWHVHSDGSLRPHDRNSEFVLRSPQQASVGLDTSLRLLEKLQKHPYSISWRCGLHMHVDYRMRESWQARNVLILGSFLDPLIFAWDGHGRQESKFCVPTSDYDKIVVNNVFHTRYGGINAASLTKHGSIEFRHAQSTLQEKKLIEYMNIVLGLCMVAYKFGNNASKLIDSMASKACLQSWVDEHFLPRAAEPLLNIKDSHPGKFMPTPKAVQASLFYSKVKIPERR